MADEGLDVPALESRPSIFGLEWLWEAFIDLNSCRASGFGPGRVPWTAVEMYANSARMSETERFILHRCIRTMDDIMIEHSDTERKKRESHKGPPAIAPSRYARGRLT